jgi:MFS superfamily sulfate permease-like transporter
MNKSSSKFANGFFSELKHDLPAGLVVFLVALPLCLGIALASGAPMFSGLIAGIIGGTLIALLSGSQLGVSGPAAGLVVIVIAGIEELGGSFPAFLLAVAIAGILQFLMGVAKAGFVTYYFPSSVIKGMLAAIGIIIILKEIPHALGDEEMKALFTLSFWQGNGENTFSELSAMWGYIRPGAVIISVVSLLIMILWEQPFVKKQSWSRIVPGALLAVILGVILNAVYNGFFPDLALESRHLVRIPTIGEGENITALLTFPDFSQWNNPIVYKTAVILAIVASLETLLTSDATDKLDPYKRSTPPNKELIAQGAGNFVSGLIGGLPITQVIVRSSANIQTGGKTKAASFFHGILLVVSVLAFPSLLNMIPLASLAAILIMVGFKLAKPTVFKKMFNIGWQQFIPFVGTIIAILITDLLIGIGIGMVIALLVILHSHYKNAFSFHKTPKEDDMHLKLTLAEEISFLNKASLKKQLAELPTGAEVEIDASRTVHIDHDVLELIQDFKEKAYQKQIKVSMTGFPEFGENRSDEKRKEMERQDPSNPSVAV